MRSPTRRRSPTVGPVPDGPTLELTFVERIEDAARPKEGAITVVMDPTWTPMPGERPDLVPARRAIGPVIEREDLFDNALERLDDWADRASLAGRLATGGVTYWYQLREPLWRWLHERLLWSSVIVDLAADRRVTRLEVPHDHAALVDVGRSFAATHATTVAFRPAPGGTAPPPEKIARWDALDRLGRLARVPARRRGRAELDRRLGLLDRRIARMAGIEAPKVLVPSHVGIRQVVDSGSGPRLVDPNLGSIIDRMPERGLTPIVVGLGLDHRVDDDWSAIDADDRLLPYSLVQTRWRGAEDPTAEVQAVVDGLEAARAIPLDGAGIDFAPLLVEQLQASAARSLDVTLRQVDRISRLLTELRPRAVLLSHEGIRLAWLVAARRRAIATFAVQHGVIYPTHPGYRHGRPADLVVPTRTFVYGEYERRVLLTFGNYRPDEVVVSGSPRLDLDLDGTSSSRTDQEPSTPASTRREVRSSLGVRDGDRLLVVSTTFDRFIRDSHFAHMLDRMLSGPLPNVHVVFKQHPGEPDQGPYLDLLHSMARAGAYPEPPATVVRDLDLIRLLRSADAHLGFLSTVLTDAVAAGTPNLIAMVEAHGDLLGYIGAGVATAVGDARQLAMALERAAQPDPAARRVFMADHFAPGIAGSMIVAEIAGCLEAEESIVRSVDVELRPAAPADAALLLAWANDPLTRWASSDRPVIEPAEHAAWLERGLAATDRSWMWIGERDGRAIGVVRFERRTGDDAEVSITVAPEQRGRGVGAALLASGIDTFDAVAGPTRLIARIRSDHAASLALFAGAGFTRTDDDTADGSTGPAIVELARERSDRRPARSG